MSRTDFLKKIETIRVALKRRGGPHDGSDAQIARLIGVDSGSMCRWLHHHDRLPRERCLKMVSLAARIAANDRGDATRHGGGLLDRLVERSSEPYQGLLQIGLEGVLREMGCGWLVDDAPIGG
jgi:hypothetical protein